MKPSNNEDPPLSQPKRTRASNPKVRSGCITCKARRVKCDERKPSCAQCTRTGRLCEGYRMPLSTPPVPRTLAPAPALDNPVELQSLEFFFIKTAPQLAGFFGAAFFQGSVLQVCLAEPAIRLAVSAIGALHEQTATAKLTIAAGKSPRTVHIQFYNRSIRSVIDKAAAGLNAFPLIAMANILFTCFEMLQGNRTAAAVHIRSGVSLLQTWREKNGGPARPWGRKYSTSESRFLETEIAPLLSLFNTNVADHVNGGRADILLNPVNEHGGLLLANRFENLAEARVALIDMVTHARGLCDRSDRALLQRHDPEIDASVVSGSVQENLKRWSTNVEGLVRRKQHLWNKKEQELAAAIRIIRLSTQFGLRSYQAENECQWDSYRSEYEELIHLASAIFSNPTRFPDSLSRTLSLDLSMIFPLHAVAYKCRWPKLRRQGLDLLLRIPRREWLFESRHYHHIFSRIMEIEEASLGLEPGTQPDENWLPAENSRIHDFVVIPQPALSNGPPVYAVTFWRNPQGLGGPSSSWTELMQLDSSQPGEVPAARNMMGRKLRGGRWIQLLSADR
ncbi:hypothetical protein BDW59DRAFT_145901 [Aspergillus cavernicola]|uniref:Zn(2)-C6 fungal-type domain-containing protein n=1 Tax=Aspergillus cavernicola TaxID=176166 RepID=A0ABR4IDS1_9EURO